MDSTSIDPNLDRQSPVEDHDPGELREVSGLGQQMLTSPHKLNRPPAASKRAEFSPPRNKSPVPGGMGSIYETILAQASPLLKAAADQKRESEHNVDETEEATTAIPTQTTATPVVEPVQEAQGNMEESGIPLKEQDPDLELRVKYEHQLAERKELQERHENLIKAMERLEQDYEKQREELEDYPHKLSEAEDLFRKKEQDVAFIGQTAEILHRAFDTIREELEELKYRYSQAERIQSVLKKEVADAKKADSASQVKAKEAEITNLTEKLEACRIKSLQSEYQLQATREEYERLHDETMKCLVLIDQARTEQIRRDEDQVRFCDRRLMELLPKKQPFRHLSVSSVLQKQTLEDFIASPFWTDSSSVQSRVNSPNRAAIRHPRPRDSNSTDSIPSSVQSSLPALPSSRHRSRRFLNFDGSGDLASSSNTDGSAASSSRLPEWTLDSPGDASPRPSRMSVEIADLQKRINMSGLVLSRSLSGQQYAQHLLDSPSRPAPLRIQGEAAKVHDQTVGNEDGGAPCFPSDSAIRQDMESLYDPSPRPRPAEPEVTGLGGASADAYEPTLQTQSPPLPMTGAPLVPADMKEDTRPGSMQMPAATSPQSQTGEETGTQPDPWSVSGSETSIPDLNSGIVSQNLELPEEIQSIFMRKSDLNTPGPSITMPSSNHDADPGEDLGSSLAVDARVENHSRRTSMSERARVTARHLAPIKTNHWVSQGNAIRGSPPRTSMQLSALIGENRPSSIPLSPHSEKVQGIAATSTGIEYRHNPGLRRRAPISPQHQSNKAAEQPLSDDDQVLARPASNSPSHVGSQTLDIKAESSRLSAGDDSPGTTICGSDCSEQDKACSSLDSAEDDRRGSSRSESTSPFPHRYMAGSGWDMRISSSTEKLSYDIYTPAERLPVRKGGEGVDSNGAGFVNGLHRKLIQKIKTFFRSPERASTGAPATNLGSKSTADLVSVGVNALKRLGMHDHGNESNPLKVVAKRIISAVVSFVGAIGSLGRTSDEAWIQIHDAASRRRPEPEYEYEAEDEDDADWAGKIAALGARRKAESTLRMTWGAAVADMRVRQETEGSLTPERERHCWAQCDSTPPFSPTCSSLSGYNDEPRHRQIFMLLVVVYVVLVLSVLVHGPLASLYMRTGSTLAQTTGIPLKGQPQTAPWRERQTPNVTFAGVPGQLQSDPGSGSGSDFVEKVKEAKVAITRKPEPEARPGSTPTETEAGMEPGSKAMVSIPSENNTSAIISRRPPSSASDAARSLPTKQEHPHARSHSQNHNQADDYDHDHAHDHDHRPGRTRAQAQEQAHTQPRNHAGKKGVPLHDRSVSVSVEPGYWGFVPGIQRRLDIVRFDLTNWLLRWDAGGARGQAKYEPRST